MKLKKTLSIIIALCLMLSICQLFPFAAQTTRNDVVFLGTQNGEAQYLEIGDDMNGFVPTYSSDSNPVPSYAKYENGFYVQGAQIGYTTSGSWFNQTTTISGLRFVIVNNLNMITKMQNAGLTNVSYGALVELDFGATLTLKNAVKVPANNIYQEQSKLGNLGYQKYTVQVKNIDATNMRTDIAVRPYLEYTDLDGNSQVLYGEQYRCDMYSLAYDAYTYGSESRSVKNAFKNDILGPYNNGSSTYALSGEYVLTAKESKNLINTWRRKTNNRIKEIKNTPNMIIPADATVYYVSNSGKDSNDGKTPATAWATLSKVNSATLNEGDYVLFERGGFFRGAFSAKTGVTYSSYGEGEKPIICGSTENGADPKKWINIGGNIWRYETAFDKDIGSIIFDDKEYATKWLVYQDKNGNLVERKTGTAWSSYLSLKGDLNFWHNNAGYSGTDYKIYLYSEQNPGERFSSIEFLRRNNGIGMGGDNITIDNLNIKYVGAHGIGGGNRKNVTVTNCSFEWIGGSIHYVNSNVNGTSEDRPVRYGNAVEIYGGVDGFTVENCYFNQIYDAAVTHQYNFADDPTSTADRGHYNVLFKDNVMENCVYSIEFFLGKTAESDSNVSVMNNIVYEGNLMWYCGQGLGSQRPDETQPAHIKGWTHYNDVKNFTIKNNFAAYSTAMFVHAGFRNKLGSKGVKFQDNTFVGISGQRFGLLEYRENANSWGGAFTEATYTPGSTQTKIQGGGGQNVTASGNRYYFVTQ